MIVDVGFSFMENWTKCLIFNGFCVWLNVKIFWFYNQMKRAIAFTNWGLKKNN